MNLRKRKSPYGVMICMPRPSDKRVMDETAEYIRQECKIPWVGLAKGGVYAEAPEYARNAMVAEALRDDDVTHILPLDADTVPPPDTILKLLQHNKDIVAGAYPLFVNGHDCWSFSFNKPLDEFGESWSIKDIEAEKIEVAQRLYDYEKLPRKPFEVKGLAGSTVLIKKEVFKNLSPPWYKTLRNSTSKPLMGHDFYFSNRAREAGYNLWIDPTVICKHYNTVELNAVFNAE